MFELGYGFVFWSDIGSVFMGKYSTVWNLEAGSVMENAKKTEYGYDKEKSHPEGIPLAGQKHTASSNGSV